MTVTIKWKLQHLPTENIIEINKPLFEIGRNPSCDISTKNDLISRSHARFTILVDEALYLQDTGSSNGTFVNENQISSNEIVPLKDGDIVNFGTNTYYTYKVIKATLLPPPVQVVEEPHTSSKVQEKKEEMPSASNEVEEPTMRNSSHFSSFHDDCIVISDDDDDDPFAMSQIFQITEKIKNESCLADDPYMEIKKELADLDYCDTFGDPMNEVIDLEPFENTKELLDILESSSRDRKKDNDVKDTTKANKSVKTIDILDDEIEIRNKDHNARGPSNSKKMSLVLEDTPPIRRISERRKSTGSSKKNDDIDTTPSSRRKSTDKNHSSAYKSKSKFKVPPLIEAHALNVDKHKPKSRPSAEKELPLEKPEEKAREHERTIKDTVKRRSSISTPSPVAQKKLKTGTRTSTPRKSKGTDQPAIDKSTKEAIKEIRKQKLKELGEKHSESKGDSKPKVVTQVPKVKDPRRGAFLLGNPPTKPSVVKSPADNPKRSSERLVERKKRSSNSAAKDSEIQDRTISSQLSPSDQLTQRVPAMNSTRVPRSDFDCITMSDFINRTQTRPDSTMHDRKTRWTQNHVYRELDNVDEHVQQIVFWNVRWIIEQQGQEISPPINKENEEMVPLDFPSVEKYARIMQPLIMLELWNYIYPSCINKNRNPFLATLKHVRYTTETTYLECECYLPENRGTSLKPEDLTLIECKLIDDENVTYQITGFGFIKYCNRIDNTREGHSKSPNVKFTLMTRYFGKRVSSKQVLIKTVDNIANFLRLLKTMRYLKTSPLVGNILNPRIEDYRIHVEHKDLNVKANKLNERQREAVLEARQVCLGHEPKIYLLKGPPGTGKSTVITSLILDVVYNTKDADDPLVLVTAPSNAAVDSLISKLALARKKIKDEKMRSRLRIVRVGPESSINSNVEKFKLSTLVRNNMVTEYRLNQCTDYQKYVEEGRLDEFIRLKLQNKFYYEQKRLEDVVLKRSNIICTTLQSCTHNKILNSWRSGSLRDFTCCIIDEATQCTELESLLPIQLGITKFVLVGDPKQLPAVVTNRVYKSITLTNIHPKSKSKIEWI
ncbi:unnamed protein product [Acanthoscelides obtectus]|uniref:FHA domain-containing protein n=1 Tax=Acanthoscelides obtectus TaxID=200917 RepID=A0A9P0JYZ1_ACAOB|nr:unnamed protein product [Acanthoscelides obtectus]CAK1654132.1 Probable helicase senataxin [Acanthoscelides obtectus]